jgi:hypothetical protein
MCNGWLCAGMQTLLICGLCGYVNVVDMWVVEYSTGICGYVNVVDMHLWSILRVFMDM